MQRLTAHVLSLLAAALLAVGCSNDAVAPKHSGPGIGPIALDAVADQNNGSLNESGRRFAKGFNPKNPHVGDAIVATFHWLGSTNIIDSVYDVLTTNPFTPVGNTYHLVDYVTAGGISMATYVATNAQNFPDTSTDQGQILAVVADLADSVADGGVTISAWSGVAAVYAQALGAHQSGSGAGSSTTTADPGVIPVAAGALAYAITMARNDSVQALDRPGGFTNIAQGGDSLLITDAEYAVPANATTLHPQWTWSFGSPNTWLASVLALNQSGGGGPSNQPPTAAFTSSCSALTCSFTSTSSDPDGSISRYSWTFGDGGTSAAQNPSYTYGTPGTYTVTLTVTDDQAATGTVSHAVAVGAGNQPPTATFTFNCSALTCSFTSTSSDPDGSITAYSWTFGDGGTSTAQSPSHGYAAAGSYTVTLTVTDNQDATNSASNSVTVTAPNQPPVVNAGPDERAITGLLYSESASFTDPNNDGPWSYTIDWGDGSRTTGNTASQGTISAGHTYIILLPRSFTITVTVTDSHGASGPDTKVVSVLLL